MLDEPCRMQGCPGHYEQERVTQAFRFPDGPIVVDDIPAEVCDICGDTLYDPEAASQLDRLMRERPATSETVPLYRYAALARVSTADAADD